MKRISIKKELDALPSTKDLLAVKTNDPAARNKQITSLRSTKYFKLHNHLKTNVYTQPNNLQSVEDVDKQELQHLA